MDWVEECKDTVCTDKVCESCPTTTTDCPVCDECPEIPEGITGGQILIYIISLLGVGGAGAYTGMQLTKDRISKIKNVTYRVKVQRDGDILEEHRHAGIRSYHNINTSHQVGYERHPRGQKFPLYETIK